MPRNSSDEKELKGESGINAELLFLKNDDVQEGRQVRDSVSCH